MLEMRARPRCSDCEAPVSSHAEGCDICGLLLLCEDCLEVHQLKHGEPAEPCTAAAQRAGCSCRMSSVNSATIDPPEPIIDAWCSLHGWRDPDRERDEKRDREMDDHPGYPCAGYTLPEVL